MMNKVLVFAGSTSKNSINKQLAKYAASMLSKLSYELVDLNNIRVPLFSVDIEKEQGFSKDLLSFNDKIDKCSGIILSLAEHNGSYTAAFKNLFDWLSRVESKTWRNKPMLLMATSPGGRGGKSVLEAAASRFPFHDGNIITKFSLPHFSKNFINGSISNKLFNKELEVAVNQLETAILIRVYP